MFACRWSSLFYTFLAVVTLAALVAAPAAAECTVLRDDAGDVDLKLHLRDGEESVQCRYKMDAPSISWFSSMDDPPEWLLGEDFRLDVYGSGLVEVEIRTEDSGGSFDFVGVSRIHIADGEFAGFTDAYADVVSDPNPETYVFAHQFNKERFDSQLRLLLGEGADRDENQEILDRAWGTMELVMTARRIRQTCWMKAWVTGDVEGPRVFHGDVAWFRTSEVAVKEGLMMGTMTDMELAETMSSQGEMSASGALDLAAQLGFISQEEREEVAAEVAELDEQREQAQGESQSFAEWLREEAGAGEGEDGDNFGLNLVALDLDANPRSDFAAAAMLTSAFTLSLSGRVMDYAPDEDTDSARIDFHTSQVQATVGIGDQGGNRIPFGLGNLQGWFTTPVESGDFIVGFLAGTLESEGKYSLGGMVPHGTGAVAANAPRILQIEVLTKFAARRGAFSCTGP